MFSNELMRFLINYEPDGTEETKKETVKEIEFKQSSCTVPVKVYIPVIK